MFTDRKNLMAHLCQQVQLQVYYYNFQKGLQHSDIKKDKRESWMCVFIERIFIFISKIRFLNIANNSYIVLPIPSFILREIKIYI